MSVSESGSIRRRARGFSLVELLVSVAILSVIMAGMLRIFASSMSGFAATSETVAIQRNARWGIGLLQEQVLEAGYLFPSRLVTAFNTINPTTAQPPLLMQTTGYAPDGTNAVDELQMVMDVPLDIQGTLTAAPAINSSTLSVNINSGSSAIMAGDYIFIQDSNWEVFRLKTVPSAGTATLDPTSVTNQFGDDQGSVVHSVVLKTHLGNAPFTIIRPLQVVRFTVLPRQLAPGGATIPCLVRQTQSFSNPGTIWKPDANSANPDPANIQPSETILQEGVYGFRVNWSLDGGQTWLRGAGDTWAQIEPALNGALTGTTTYNKFAGSPAVQLSGGAANPADPFWTNYTPVLIRIDLTTRTRIARTEFNQQLNPSAPVAAYRTRTETLMLSPRNFANGHP